MGISILDDYDDTLCTLDCFTRLLVHDAVGRQRAPLVKRAVPGPVAQGWSKSGR